jgi:hypothetical protein
MSEKNYFEILNNINVSDKIEKKNNLSYLSWAWAWGEVKKLYPCSSYKVYEREDSRIYWCDGKTAWVKTGVTINEIEHIEYLPVMDFRNASISVETIKSTDVNKAIQRSLTKAIARHGLGLYIYAGEDLPECESDEVKPKEKKKVEEFVFATDEQVEELNALGVDLAKMREHYKVGSIKELSKDLVAEVIVKKTLENKKSRAEADGGVVNISSGK